MSPPSVSVIVPVRNARQFVPRLVAALRSQDYPADAYELVFVDNGSTDDSGDRLRRTGVRVLQQPSIVSPSAARNCGIRRTSSDIVAFIDADCSPESDWLSSAVGCLLREGADIVAGRVAFTFTRRRSPVELYDAVVHMDNKRAASRGLAVSANLVVRRELFDRYGLFREDVKSGEDYAWTNAAVRGGAKLTYCPDAVVRHPTRNLRESLRKGLRVGSGLAHLDLYSGYRIGRAAAGLLFVAEGFVPILAIATVRRYRRSPYRIGGLILLLRVCFVAYLVRYSQALGLVAETWRSMRRRRA